MSKARFLLAATALSAIAGPAFAAEVRIEARGPVVELTVNEVVHSPPDAAQVSAGVQLRARTASEAMRQNAAQMEKVIARLRQAGIRGEDIQTSNFSLNPQYQYRDNNQPPLFLGYEASNQVSVRLRDLSRIGSTLDALVEAGANNVGGPNFILEKDDAAKQAARKSAFDGARAQAEEYARMAGFSSLRLLEVSETYAQVRPMANEIMVTAQRAGSAKTPIEPGQVGTGVTVTVKYEMTR